MIRVRLVKKLASILDGVDVSLLSVGEILELPDSSAAMLIAEKWAEPIAERVADIASEASGEHVMTYFLLQGSDRPVDSVT